MWGFQLWVNLPAKEKMCEPRYQEFPPERIPVGSLDDGTQVRVIAGRAGQVSGPVTGIVTSPLYLDVTVPAEARFDQSVPRGHNAFVYVFVGDGTVGEDKVVSAGHLAVCQDGDAVRITGGESGVRLLLIAAEPLVEPVARFGPFVMNTQEELRQAVRDFQGGLF